MRKLALALAATAALSIAAPAQAVVLLADAAGHLTGATGILIGGSSYDVTFLDGTCVALFGGCDASSDFEFQTLVDANAASQALLDQVLLNGAVPYDGAYYLTVGCSPNSNNLCVILTPYSLGFDTLHRPVFLASVAVNTSGTTSDFTDTAFGTLNFDSGDTPIYTWARFTPSAGGVPEPSTWAMMLLGFGAIGLAMRRRLKVAALA
jgi:hypothetical protein